MNMPLELTSPKDASLNPQEPPCLNTVSNPAVMKTDNSQVNNCTVEAEACELLQGRSTRSYTILPIFMTDQQEKFIPLELDLSAHAPGPGSYNGRSDEQWRTEPKPLAFAPYQSESHHDIVLH
nr:uncharacterized protein LOC105481664 [Macaca nemestrina]XP_024648617.1 uncharacterized protein LOC105481664 [Macaca nemestrina]XP_024648618.1 uncharacterized protein LOC105481664 [Macaca nemestrina]